MSTSASASSAAAAAGGANGGGGESLSDDPSSSNQQNNDDNNKGGSAEFDDPNVTTSNTKAKQKQPKAKEDTVHGIVLSFPTAGLGSGTAGAGALLSAGDGEGGTGPNNPLLSGGGGGMMSGSSGGSEWGGMDDPTSFLSGLRDEHSSYHIVARAVQQICQFASHGVSQAWSATDAAEEGPAGLFLTTSTSVVVHTPSYTKLVNHAIQSLLECLASHKDRRCRSLAAHTLAVVGKAAYARIRPSPLLYTARDTTIYRLQDELGAELPTALITAVLQEEDEGVSSTALEAVGRLVVFHSSTTSVAVGGASHAMMEDVLTRELLAIVAPKVAPTAPTVRALVDEDGSIPVAELAVRCLQTVIVPRLLPLLERVVRYTTTTATVRVLPVLTTALIYFWQTSQPVMYPTMDRLAYAKQWATVDAAGLIETFWNRLLWRILQDGVDGPLVQTAALAAIRLCQAASQIGTSAAPAWMFTTCRQVAVVQQEALTATPLSLQQKMNLLATILIAARALPFPERSAVLFSLVDTILALPSTTRVPLGVLSPGLVLAEYTNRSNTTSNNKGSSTTTTNEHPQPMISPQLGHHYRRPARITYWTELALHFFLDGPTPSRLDLQMSQLVGTAAASGGLTTGGGGAAGQLGKSAAAAAAATAAAGGGRQEALRKFFHLPVVSSAISEASFLNARSSPLLPRDEILVAFTTVAIACGRRFRGGTVDPSAAAAGHGGAGGHHAATNAAAVAAAAASLWPFTDPSSPAVEEWLQLSWIVLTALVPCVNMAQRSSNSSGKSTTTTATYLEEDLSLSTAGLMCYVQLLQEYLHFAGLLHPGSSVALKLVANACPPHLLWDQLSDSAAFLARFEALDMGLLDNTTKLMDEIVAREMTKTTHGIPSHHMRLFLLALASDHWMQGRVAAIRKQFESAATGGFGGGLTASSPPNLDAASAREIILALSPKRILTKIFQAHVPPVDAEGKKKKDPIKRLAVETVRVCVACIENIALIACDWRKRFPPPATSSSNGPHQEPKHVVSVAVGVLQGKVDETPMNETIKSIMGPICEAAVSRIQSFYESDLGGQDSFPASELVMQNVKTKIKPLVSSSSSRPPLVTKDDYARGYLMQLCRSLVQSRAEQAIHSFPPGDAELAAPARATNWLRLTVASPMMADTRDGRLLGNHVCTTDTFGSSVTMASAGSDPVAILLGFTPRRYFRHDGEEEFRITALMQVYNTTNIEFTDGLRLDLAVVNQGDYHYDGGGMTAAGTDGDSLQKSIREALGLAEDETLLAPLSSASVVCKQELKPGEYLSWEVALDHLCIGEGLCLVPTVVFPNVPKEPAELGSKWTGEAKQGGDSSTINTGSADGGGGGGGGEDDFQVTTETMDYNRSGGRGLKDADKPSENISLVGEALPLPPMVQLQPCPLIFLRDRWGDLDAFRLLWFRMPYHLPEIPLMINRKAKVTITTLEPSHLYGKDNRMMIALANMSSLVWNGEAIPGGYVTRAWAFSTFRGQRVLAVLSESDSDKKLALHFRGDDPHVLYGLVGPPRNRQRVVAALTPDLKPAHLD